MSGKAREGYVYKRGAGSPYWWIAYGFMGKDNRESSKSTVRSDAVKLLQKRLKEISEGKFTPDGERVTFEDLERIALQKARHDELRSAWRIEYAFKNLRKRFAGTPALWIPRRIPGYIEARRKYGAKNATIKYELGCLRRAFSIAASPEHRLLAYRPTFDLPAVRNVRKNFIDEEALGKIMQNLPDYLAPVLEFCYLTGFRRSEAIGLPWAWVEWSEDQITLPPGTTKSGEGRIFPFGPFPRLLALMKARRAAASAWELTHPGQKVERVFWRPDGDEAMPIGNIHKTFQRAARNAGYEGTRLHDARRSAVRDLRRTGVSAYDSMKLIGHESLDMLKRYNITIKDDLVEAIAKRGALDAAKAGGGN